MVSKGKKKNIKKVAKKALIGLTREYTGEWTQTHDRIFDEFDGLKDEYYDPKKAKKEPKFRDCIKRNCDFAKRHFESIKDSEEDYFEYGYIGDVIQHMSTGLKNQEMECICRGEAIDLHEKYSIELLKGSTYIYMMATAITYESLENLVSV